MTAYRSIPVFDENTLPAALRADHRAKNGTWRVINVLEDELRLTFTEPVVDQLLSPGRPGLVDPGQTHFVTPIGTIRMRVDVHNSAPDTAVLATANGREA